MTGSTGVTGDAAPGEDLLRQARAAYLETPTPTPPGLVETAMRAVALDLRPGQRIRLAAASGVRGFVTDVAVANALRLAQDDDPAIVARRCRVEPGTDGIRVRLTLAVSYVHWHRRRDDAVRDRVVATARDLFGLVVRAVDLEIVDLIDDLVDDLIDDLIDDLVDDPADDGGTTS